jgi:nucleoside 2-deoxyribosyltransferase
MRSGDREMKKTYLCGGINGLGDAECRDWREVAKASLITDTLDPMRRDYRGKEDESVEDIVFGDLADIEVSDCVLVNASRPSWGTAMEIVYAFQLGKSIVAFSGGGAVSPWLRYHCTRIVATIEEAVLQVNGLAR